MEKIININIDSNEDILERYDKGRVSDELISYLLERTKYLKKSDTTKIIIKNETNLDGNAIKKLIVAGLKEDYDESVRLNSINNSKEFLFFLIGLFLIFLSNLDSDVIGKELLLIGGWIFVWETIEMELVSDSFERRKRMILKKLINSKFVINK